MTVHRRVIFAILAATLALYGCPAPPEADDIDSSAGGGSVATDNTSPSTPTGLTTSGLSPSQVDLGWLASTDNVAVTNYRVYRGGALVTTLGNVTTYRDASLSASTTYSYTVQAIDGAGNASGQSTAVIVTTPATADSVAPTTPTALTANAVSGSRIDLAWSPATDNVAVTGYRLFLNGALLLNLGNVTTFQHTGLAPSTTYSYNVDAVDAVGNASGLSLAASATTPATPDTTAPSTPTGLTANAVSSNQINLNWSASTDNVAVTGYQVFRGGTLLITLGNVTTYQNTGLTASTTYSYRVRAIDLAGNTSNQSNSASATTQAAPDTTAPTTPAGLTANAYSSSRINLSWSASTDNVGVTGYRIYRDNVFLAAVGQTTTYQSAGLSASTTYSYKVDAVDAVGNASGISTAVTATTLAPNTVTLAWDAVIGASGYRIYYGTASRTYFQAVGAGVNVGNVTTYTVTGLGSSTRYYFGATAYDASNNESDFSNEVFKDIP